MSPNSKVALIALFLFFAVAGVSIFWPHLAGPERWRKLASRTILDTIKVPRRALPLTEEKDRDRPLSPHLQIYRWTWTMAMSIMHRVTGGALYVGTILLAFWLLSMASGPEVYDRAQRFFGSAIGLAILLVYTFMLMHHMVGGIRHLIWDAGYGMEPDTRKNMALATPFAATLLTSLIWFVAQLFHATPPQLFQRTLQ